MLIRRLVERDSPTYRGLMLDAYQLHPDAFTSSVAEREVLPISWWSKRVVNDDNATDVVFGAFEGKELIGVAGVSFESREKTNHKSTLFGMYVPSASRGHGLGRTLVMQVLECAASRTGVRIIQLTVTDGNAPAQALYESCGFIAIGIEPMAVRVGDRFVSKVHMWRSLESVST